MKNFFKKIIISFLLLFSYTVFLNAFAWVPLKTFVSNNERQTELIKKIISKETITYCIDEDDYAFKGVSFTPYRMNGSVMDEGKAYDTTEAEIFFQHWFKNVLKRRKKYPNFDMEFASIIPILEYPEKMKKVFCGPAPTEYSFESLMTAQEGYPTSSEIEDVRIVYSSQKMLSDAAKIFSAKEESTGFYTVLPDRKLIWVPKTGSFVEQHILLHEFGHLLGFADVSYDEEKQAKEYGSQTQNTIMSITKSSLTCDDADGIVALLYLALEEDKTFRSFCDKNTFYSNGKKIVLPDFDKIEEKNLPLNLSTLTPF